MQTTIPQIKRDITYQECTISGQSVSYAECSSPYQSFLPQSPISQTLECCHMTTFQSNLSQTPPTGKTKWKTNNTKPAMQRHSCPPQPQTMSSPVVFNTYSNPPTYPDPRGQVLPPYDPYYYNTQSQPYYPNNYPSGNVYPNGYRPQVQSPQPRPYLTITQVNYQPMGYTPQNTNSNSSTNLVFGPPPRDRRLDNSYYSQQFDVDRPTPPKKILEQPRVLYVNNAVRNEEKINSLKTDEKSDSSGSFEFTIQPEQIVNSLCDEKEQEIRVDNVNQEVNAGCHMYSPKMWENETMNPLRIEDDELTKFIVEGCLKAETIAVRNQHRPCFKNIKHLCTRTRTDILKPRTTVANIHSQGIPWATKDFIFAFVRLINCWYILKGYLDDHDGSLGKIETTLTEEFKECYQKWQNNNKDMVRHLINIFVNLDNGITVQNAEIFSSFNQMSNANLQNNFPNLDIQNRQTVKSCINKFPEQPTQDFNKTKLHSQSEIFLEANKHNVTELFSNDIETCNLKLKHSQSESKMSSVPGILRVKDIFNSSTSTRTSPKNEEETDSDHECRHKIYMKPGSYRVPKRTYVSPQDASPRADKDTSNDLEGNTNHNSSQDTNLSNLETKESESSDVPTPEEAWKSALETIGPFMKSVMQDSESSYGSPINPDKRNFSSESSGKESEADNPIKHKYKTTKDTQAWVDEHQMENCMDEHIEEVSDKPRKTDKRFSKQSTRKNHVTTRTYRKKADDSLKKPMKSKSVDGAMCPTVAKKNEPNVLNTMCFLSRRHIGMSSVSISKFEKILQNLWHLQFSKYICYENNLENVPEYCKYIRKPIPLSEIMNDLKQSKYKHPYEVVHDLRSIIRTFEQYLEKHPDWWFEKCLQSFSKELDSQLAEKFPSIDFSLVSGESAVEDPIEDPLDFNTSTENNEFPKQDK